MQHIITVDDFTAPHVMELIQQAEVLRIMPRLELRKRLFGAVVATLFYEPSTRTRLSFESAVTKLGGRVVGAENARENSSAKKGETLRDVVRVVGAYVDTIVIRHHEDDALQDAAEVSPVPIINAGAGSGEHPTQALLDAYTMWREFGRIDGLKVCVIGDLKYGRTVHSLLRLLTKFRDVQVTVVHPSTLGLPEDEVEGLMKRGLTVKRSNTVTEGLEAADVVYQTRIQRERLVSEEEAMEAQQYAILPEHLGIMRPDARILHPLPRVGEIDERIDTDERAAYFRQAENGLFIRMALLDEVVGGMLK